jgi:nitroreductase
MEFSELIEKRYSVRAYKADAVEDDKLQQVLRAARLAPSAGNLRLDTRDKLARKGRQRYLALSIDYMSGRQCARLLASQDCLASGNHCRIPSGVVSCQ